MNLADALQSELDKQILTRATEGLLAFGTAPTNPSSETTAAEYLAAVYAGADGLYAQASAEVKMLVGATIYAHMGGKAVATGSDINSAEKVMAISGGLRVSGHVADYANNRQEALIIKGMPRRNCVAAIWPNVPLIVDRISRSTQGEVKLTAMLLYDFSLTREAGYTRHRFRNS